MELMQKRERTFTVGQIAKLLNMEKYDVRYRIDKLRIEGIPIHPTCKVYTVKDMKDIQSYVRSK